MIFKIVDQAKWREAVQNSRFDGAAIDIQDGFIHFSTGDQVEETAKRHFAGVENLVLLAFDESQFGAELKWEVSRGGALFPHLYAVLDPAMAMWAKPLPWINGVHQFPFGWNS